MRVGQSLVTGQSNGTLGIGGPPAPITVSLGSSRGGSWAGTLTPLVSGPVIRQVVITGPGGVIPAGPLPFNPSRFSGPQFPVVVGLPNGQRGFIWSSVPMAMPTATLFSGWSSYFSAPATRHVWQPLLLGSLLAIPLLCYLVLKISAWQVARGWRDAVPSVSRESWIKTFCLPRKTGRFAEKMRATLERNPIAWLQQYSWKSRLSKWGLCLAILVVDAIFSTGGLPAMVSAQSPMLLILLGCFTFAGVNGFLIEKNSVRWNFCWSRLSPQIRLSSVARGDCGSSSCPLLRRFCSCGASRNTGCR